MDWAEDDILSDLRSEKFSKKTVHFNLSTDAHGAFRIACFERNLSMQEVFEEFVQQVLAETPVVLRFMDDLSDHKKHRSSRKFSKQDAESIFDMIENNRTKDY